MMRAKQFLSIFCLILFLLTFAITLTINAKWLYVIDIDKLGILNEVTLSKNELLKNYTELMRYLNYIWVNPLSMSDFPVSESGAFHFYEVKRLFQLNYSVLFITAVPSILFLKKSLKEGTFWQLIRPFSYLLIGLITLLIFMGAAFDTFFVKFHEVFFNNDDWLFDPITDPIITVLPQDYFMHCFILFFILFVLFILVIIFVGNKQLKELKR